MLMRLMAGFLLLFTGSVGAVEPAAGVSGNQLAEQEQESLPTERADATEGSHTEPAVTEQIKDCISKNRSWIECYKEVYGGRTVVYTTAYFSNPVASADTLTDGLWLYKSIDFEKLKTALSTTAPTTSE